MALPGGVSAIGGFEEEEVLTKGPREVEVRLMVCLGALVGKPSFSGEGGREGGTGGGRGGG